MSIIKKGLINISKGFSYSINIKFDINNLEKINSYIPTDYTVKLLEDIISKSYGANILVGSYGTGKSHFATVLTSILTNRFEKKDYNELLKKISITNKDLKLNIENRIKNNSKKLLILPHHSIKDIKSSVLVGLKEALEKENLEHIIPETSFDAVKSKVLDWKENYEVTYRNFIETLENEYKIDSQDFINKLDKYDEEVFYIFEKIYPTLTAGSVFSPLHHIEIMDLLKQVNEKIKEKGFEGIVIVFDEFGKYMEENINSINLKDIQDIAEYTNNQEEKSNLILITHRDLSQYVDSKDEESMFEWRKVEGRFTKHIFKSDEYQVFDLIGKVLIKEKNEWKKFQEKNQSKFNQMRDDMFSIELFKDMPKDVQNNLIDNLYPLHPVSAYSLIKLSDKLAQNERTTFTFLCSDKKNTLIDYIENDKSSFPVINTDIIYDFYEDLMKKESKNSEIYNNWKSSKGALNLIDKDNKVKISIIKALAIINIINQENVLKPSYENIRVLANLNTDCFQENMDELIKDKVLIYRKSIKQYNFYQGSYLDIEEILKDMPSEEYSFLDLLESEFSLIPIMPRRHNDDKKINRILECKYISIYSIDKDIDEKEYYKDVSDGKMLYFIPSNKNEIKQAKEWAERQQEVLRTIIAVPSNYFEIVEKLDRYEKLKKLIEDEEFLSQDNLLEEEIKLYLEDARTEIYNELNQIIGDNYKCLDIYYKGEKIEIKNKSQLNNKISDIFDEIYNSTFTVNNEMIIKNNVSPTMKRVIKNVLKCYWETDKIIETEEFTEFSAEGTLIRTVFKNSNILNEDNKPNDRIKVIKEINNFLDNSSKEEKNFEELYKTIKDNPYGVKDGLIPILLAVVFKNYPGQIYIYRRGKDDHINPDMFMEVIKKPSYYSIYTEKWDRDKQNYIEKLEELFKENIDTEKNKFNRLQSLYDGLKTKYISLSRFARSTNMLSENSIKIRNIIENEYIDLRKLFFEILTFGNKVSYEKTYNSIKNLFNEMDNFIYNIRKELLVFIKELFSENITVNNYKLKDLLNKWKQNNHKSIDIVYSDENINNFINMIQDIPNNESDIDYIAQNILGIELNYFDDKFYDKFKRTLENIKESIDSEEKTSEEELYSINIMSPSGKYKKIIKDDSISRKGNILQKKIESDISNFGKSINEEEIISILIELVKKY